MHIYISNKQMTSSDESHKHKKHHKKTDKFLKEQNALTSKQIYQLAPSNIGEMAAINAQLVGFTLAQIPISAGKISDLYTILIENGTLTWNDLYQAGITPSLSGTCPSIQLINSMNIVLNNWDWILATLQSPIHYTVTHQYFLNNPNPDPSTDAPLLANIATGLQNIYNTANQTSSLAQYNQYYIELGQLINLIDALNASPNPPTHTQYLGTGGIGLTTTQFPYSSIGTISYGTTPTGQGLNAPLSIDLLNVILKQIYTIYTPVIASVNRLASIAPGTSPTALAEIYANNMAIILNGTSTASPNGVSQWITSLSYTETYLLMQVLVNQVYYFKFVNTSQSLPFTSAQEALAALTGVNNLFNTAIGPAPYTSTILSVAKYYANIYFYGHNNPSTHPAPEITSLSAYSGPVSGGTTVTINGVNFQNAGTVLPIVTINGASATVISYTSTQITITTPPNPVGMYQVIVKVKTGYVDPQIVDFNTYYFGFTYTQ